MLRIILYKTNFNNTGETLKKKRAFKNEIKCIKTVMAQDIRDYYYYYSRLNRREKKKRNKIMESTKSQIKPVSLIPLIPHTYSVIFGKGR